MPKVLTRRRHFYFGLVFARECRYRDFMIFQMGESDQIWPDASWVPLWQTHVQCVQFRNRGQVYYIRDGILRHLQPMLLNWYEPIHYIVECKRPVRLRFNKHVLSAKKLETPKGTGDTLLGEYFRTCWWGHAWPSFVKGNFTQSLRSPKSKNNVIPIHSRAKTNPK